MILESWIRRKKEARNEKLISYLESSFDSAHSLLDVSCGTGEMSLALAKRFGIAQVQGVDIARSPKLVDIPFKLYDGKHIPFPDDSFDVVLLTDVLHHSPSQESLLAEALRVSKQKVIVKDHMVTHFFDPYTLMVMDFLGNGLAQTPGPSAYNSREEWEAVFSKLNLKTKWVYEKLSLYPKILPTLTRDDLHFIIELRKNA